MRHRVHRLHHLGRSSPMEEGLMISVREVPSGEEEDCQWRGHNFRHDEFGVRELCRGAEDLSRQVSQGKMRPVGNGSNGRVIRIIRPRGVAARGRRVAGRASRMMICWRMRMRGHSRRSCNRQTAAMDVNWFLDGAAYVVVLFFLCMDVGLLARK
jgi:hypothetical protein